MAVAAEVAAQQKLMASTTSCPPPVALLHKDTQTTRMWELLGWIPRDNSDFISQDLKNIKKNTRTTKRALIVSFGPFWMCTFWSVTGDRHITAVSLILDLEEMRGAVQAHFLCSCMSAGLADATANSYPCRGRLIAKKGQKRRNT